MESEVAQSCPTLCDPMDCSLPGSSVHGIFQARELEWGAISFSRGSSWPRDRTWISCIAGRRFIVWATREVPVIIQVEKQKNVESKSWELSFIKGIKMATHSRTIAWKIPWTEEPGRLQSMGSQRVGHDWATSLFWFISWRYFWLWFHFVSLFLSILKRCVI